MNFNKYLFLTWKKFFVILGAWLVAIVLHNLVYAVFQNWFDAHGGDEAFFFIVAVIIIPLYFFVAFIYSVFKKITSRTFFEKDFILMAIFSVLAGLLASFLIVKTTIINYPAMGILTFIFSLVVYFLIKVFKEKFR